MNHKFRAWDTTKKEYSNNQIFLQTDGWILDNTIDDGRADIIIEMFTGLKDSKGVEIYCGDLLRGNIDNQKYPEYKFEGIYQVVIAGHRGVEFHFKALAWEDGVKNQIPIRQYIRSEYLYERWHNKNGVVYNEIDSGQCVESDFEVIGNIHENPNLLEQE